MKLGSLAQQIVLAKLNHLLKPDTTAGDLARMFSTGSKEVSMATDRLVRLGILGKRRGQGPLVHHILYDWHKSGRELWDYALPYMRSPVVETLPSLEPSNPADFTPGGESLLAVSSPWYVLHTPPCLVSLKRSTKGNASRIPSAPRASATHVVEFWRYPPLLPGLAEIDNLSLYLALASATDRSAKLYRWVLLETFDFDGNGKPKRRRR